MRKITAIVAIMVMFFLPTMPAAAQSWRVADSAVLQWDAVAKPAPTDALRYQVWTKFGDASAAPQKAGGEITDTQATVTFATEGRYFLCVQTMRYPQGEAEAIGSTLACSHDPAVTQAGAAFGIKYFAEPAAPGGLR